MITVRELTKTFQQNGKEFKAVDALSFVVKQGEVYGLLGPNGAGKTTTLRMVLGLLRPDSGYAEVGGFRSTEAPHEVKSRIGLVSANDGVYPWLTAREMLLFFADLYGMQIADAKQRLESLIEPLRLESFLDQRCSTLSTGQKQRVILARGLIHDPPVMLLDEPTRGLDVVGTQVVFEYINHLRTIGKAVIVSTHRLDEAQRLCDRFGLLHQGHLLHEGNLEQLQKETGCDSLVDMFVMFMNSPDVNAMKQQAAADAGADA